MLHIWQCEEGQRVRVVKGVRSCAFCDEPLRDHGLRGRYGTVVKAGTKWLHVRMEGAAPARFLIHGRDGFLPHVPELHKCNDRG